MRNILSITLALLISVATFADGGWRENEKQVRVAINSAEQSTILFNLKLNGDFYGDHAILYVTPHELKRIESKGLRYEVQIDNLNDHYKDFWSNRDAYHTYQEIIDIMDSLVTAFPDICSKTVYGTSIQGRELSALKISDNVATDENEAEILFDGGIHGDEIGAAENLIRFARHLCLEYGNDQYITDLIDDREIWLYIMVNPDGRVNMSRYNGNGVDLNRDWGYMWDAWGNSTGAYSQVESKGLRSCMYENQFAIHITYHSGIEYISYPWSYRSSNTPDEDHIDYLASLYSSLSGYPNLPYGQGNTGMYAINGSTKDSNYGVMGSVSWTMEISDNKQPPASQIMMFYNWNKPSMLSMIENSGYGIEGLITDSNTGDPVQAIVYIDEYFQCYNDPVVGDYHKYVGPGTYTINVVANGYIPKTVSNVVVSDYTSTIVKNIQLVADSGRYAYRMPSCRIPNNNEADEGNTKAAFGAPDEINYSIGKNGWAVLDMQDPITDGPGIDLIVHEGDDSPEGYTCWVSTSMDGPWESLGNGNGTTEFDLSTAFINNAKFVKIDDDGNGAGNADNAGFDLDAIEVVQHPSGIYLSVEDYYPIDTGAGGNGNHHIDPGETVDIVVTLINNGDNTAQNAIGVIQADPLYVTVNSDSAVYGNITSGSTASGTYNISVSSSTPHGQTINIQLDVTSNNGNYSNSYTLGFTVGQIPMLIIDLDQNMNSGTVIQQTSQNMDITSDYVTEFPANLEFYNSVFVCLGVYDANYTLGGIQGQLLADFLDAGGNIYMEGGDTWAYDNATAVHPYFNIEGLDDGEGDLGTINGYPGFITDGMTFTYDGDNNFIDQIAPIAPAVSIFSNQDPQYICAVAHDGGSYKTIGSSFEFGGLTDGQSPSTKEILLQRMLDFFDGIYTGVEPKPSDLTTDLQVAVYPNPVKDELNISFNSTEGEITSIEIMDIMGRRSEMISNRLIINSDHVKINNDIFGGWNELPEGIYVLSIRINNEVITKKIIKVN